MNKFAAVVLALAFAAPVLASAATVSNIPPLGYIPPAVACTFTATPTTPGKPISATSTATVKWTTTNAVTTSWSGNTAFSATTTSGTAVVPLKSFLSMFFLTAVGKYGLGVAICNANVTLPLF